MCTCPSQLPNSLPPSFTPATISLFCINKSLLTLYYVSIRSCLITKFPPLISLSQRTIPVTRLHLLGLCEDEDRAHTAVAQTQCSVGVHNQARRMSDLKEPQGSSFLNHSLKLLQGNSLTSYGRALRGQNSKDLLPVLDFYS